MAFQFSVVHLIPKTRRNHGGEWDGPHLRTGSARRRTYRSLKIFIRREPLTTIPQQRSRKYGTDSVCVSHHHNAFHSRNSKSNRSQLPRIFLHRKGQRRRSRLIIHRYNFIERVLVIILPAAYTPSLPQSR